MSRSNRTDYTHLLGRRVCWSSQGAGIARKKTGLTVAVRKDKSSPWQWLTEDQRQLNERTPAGEHSRGQTVHNVGDHVRVIVLLDSTSSRVQQPRYAVPHGSLLAAIDT